MAEQDHILEMRRRFGRHMGTALLGVLGALVVAGVAGGIASSLAPDSIKRFIVLAAVASAMVIAPTVGIWSARRNLRCPACEAPIWGMMNRHARPLSGPTAVHCPKCGVLLFDQRRSRGVFIGLVIAGVVLAMAGAAASMLARH